MKKELIAVLVAALTVSVFAADPSPTAGASAAPSAQTSDKAVNTVCPVSGDRIVGFVGKPLSAQYQGKMIAVCCNDCLTKFQKNPDKYGPLALKNDSANEPMKR
jgi:YHS domain-containing protein